MIPYTDIKIDYKDLFSQKYVISENKSYIRRLKYKHSFTEKDFVNNPKYIYDKGTIKVGFVNPYFIEPQIVYDSGIYLDTNELIQCHGYKRTPFDFVTPVMFFNNKPIMSITPLEVESQYLPIKYAHGHVLALGLGLGYYISNIINKKSVTKITVIENNPNVIDFYNKFFPQNDKLTIIHEDMNNLSGFSADFCFNDVYSTGLSFRDIFIDFLNLKDNNSIDHYFSWTQEAIILGLMYNNVYKEYSIESLLNTDIMHDYSDWLSLGIPYVMAFSNFLNTHYGLDDYIFDKIILSEDEFRGWKNQYYTNNKPYRTLLRE